MGNNELQDQLGLGPIDQVGFVVKDLDKAIASYQPLFGEFTIMDAHEMEWDYRGRKEMSSIKLALAKSGDVEIELIEWISGETPHKEFIDQGREGLHHIRFRVDNLEEKMKEVEKHGFESIWYKRFGEGLAAVYMQKQGDPVYIELFENLH